MAKYQIIFVCLLSVTIFASSAFASSEGWLTDLTYGEGDHGSQFEKKAAPYLLTENCPENGPHNKPAISELIVDSDIKEQLVDGFGAALTESAAINLMSLSAESRDKVLQELFSKEGLGIGILRVPVGATDFSLSNYSCDDPPSGVTTDPKMKYFSLNRCAETFVPLLKKIRQINPDIKLMATPWSAPAWMKSNGTMIGGSLRPEFSAAYANYFVHFLSQMKKNGIPFHYLTVVNEPLFPGGSYPFMNMTWQEQRDFIVSYLGPALAKEKAMIGPVGILIFDHNTMDFEFPLNILKDSQARSYVAGTAFHCYEGTGKLMHSLKEAFPTKQLHLTECSLGGWFPKFGSSMEFMARDLVIQNFGEGSQSLLLWNLTLNPEYGPTNKGCMNCRGIVTVHKDKTKESLSDKERDQYLDLPGKGQVKKEPEYFLFSHLAKILKPGAYKIASTFILRSQDKNAKDLEQVAFVNSDNSVGVFMLNSSSNFEQVFRLRSGKSCQLVHLPPRSVGTILVK